MSVRDIFNIVKQISCNDAAEKIGLKGKRVSSARGMWCCPFHEDRNPSMACFDKDNRFYCFSCHARGDAADLYARVFNLTQVEGAKRALADFGYQLPQGEGAPAGCDRPQDKTPIRQELVERIARLVRSDYREAVILLMRDQARGMQKAMQESAEDGWVWNHALQRGCKLVEEAKRWENLTDDELQLEIREHLRQEEDQSVWGEGLPTPTRPLFRRILDELEALARIPKLNLQELTATLDLLTEKSSPVRGNDDKEGGRLLSTV